MQTMNQTQTVTECVVIAKLHLSVCMCVSGGERGKCF